MLLPATDNLLPESKVVNVLSPIQTGLEPVYELVPIF